MFPVAADPALISTAGIRDEAGVFTFLDRLEEQFRQLSVQLGEMQFFKYMRKQTPEGFDAAQAARSALLRHPDYRAVVDHWAGRVGDPIQARRLALWQRSFTLAAVGAHPDVVALQTRLADAIAYARYPLGDGEVELAAIRHILRAEPDREQRRAAFHAAGRLSAGLAGAVRELIHLRNQLARDIAVRDYPDLAFRLQGLNRSQVEGFLTDLLARTAPAYRADLDRLAAEAGITGELQPWDMAYLLEDRFAPPARYFPVSAISPRLEAFARRHGLDPNNLGIRVFSVDIPYNGLCMGIDPPHDIRILANPGDGHRYHDILLHEYGHALHSAFIDQPYLPLRWETSPFSEAMAETIARFSWYPEWLAECGLDVEEVAAAPRQKRLGWWHFLRQRSAYALFEYGAYDNPDQDLDALMGEAEAAAMGTAADPAPRWAANAWYVSYPVYWHSYVLGRAVASQVHAALARTMQPVYGNPAAVAFLREQFWAPGAGVEWLDKLERATGAGVAPDALVADLLEGSPH